MRLNKLLAFVALLFVYATAAAQDVPSIVKQQLESLAETGDPVMEPDANFQQLQYYKEHPLNINTATADELQTFYFLTDVQIQNLLAYHRLFGHLITAHELQSVPAWDVATIEKLLPFIKVEEPLQVDKLFQKRFTAGEYTTLVRAYRQLQPIKSDVSNQYKGDANHYLLRFNYRYNNLLQYGFTADKDAGEQFFKGAQKSGFDFYSMHVFMQNIGSVKAIALGDFTVNLGQGLIQWQSLAFKKSADVMNIKRQSAVLRPYTSAGEFYFNRGAGITVSRRKMEATVFGSVRKLDGNIEKDSAGASYFTSLYTYGLHRTDAELQHKNSIQQLSFGGNVKYNWQRLSMGINAVQYHFSAPMQKQPQPYNLFSIQDKSWRNLSVDYSYTYKNIHLFGEAAGDKLFQKAFISGALISLDAKVDVSLLYRNINKAYQSVSGNAFTENYLPTNEKGFYAGARIRPTGNISIDAYADVYAFPWLKYRVNAGSKGADYLVQVTYTPNKQFQIYSRYSLKSKQQNHTGTEAINYTTYEPHKNWRIHFSYNLSPSLILKSRVEVVWVHKKDERESNGSLFYTELQYASHQKLGANFRFQYFETTNYNSRLYAYESDVLYAYSIPAFYGNGFKYYTNANYKVNKCISLWARWAQMVATNNSITPRKIISELKLQAIIIIK